MHMKQLNQGLKLSIQIVYVHIFLSLLCSTSLHLFDQDTVKTVD